MLDALLPLLGDAVQVAVLDRSYVRSPLLLPLPLPLPARDGFVLSPISLVPSSSRSSAGTTHARINQGFVVSMHDHESPGSGFQFSTNPINETFFDTFTLYSGIKVWSKSVESGEYVLQYGYGASVGDSITCPAALETALDISYIP